MSSEGELEVRPDNPGPGWFPIERRGGPRDGEVFGYGHMAGQVKQPIRGWIGRDVVELEYPAEGGRK
jgi:hypothetical protein